MPIIVRKLTLKTSPSQVQQDIYAVMEIKDESNPSIRRGELIIRKIQAKLVTLVNKQAADKKPVVIAFKLNDDDSVICYRSNAENRLDHFVLDEKDFSNDITPEVISADHLIFERAKTQRDKLLALTQSKSSTLASQSREVVQAKKNLLHKLLQSIRNTVSASASAYYQTNKEFCPFTEATQSIDKLERKFSTDDEIYLSLKEYRKRNSGNTEIGDRKTLSYKQLRNKVDLNKERKDTIIREIQNFEREQLSHANALLLKSCNNKAVVSDSKGTVILPTLVHKINSLSKEIEKLTNAIEIAISRTHVFYRDKGLASLKGEKYHSPLNRIWRNYSIIEDDIKLATDSDEKPDSLSSRSANHSLDSFLKTIAQFGLNQKTDSDSLSSQQTHIIKTALLNSVQASLNSLYSTYDNIDTKNEDSNNPKNQLDSIIDFQKKKFTVFELSDSKPILSASVRSLGLEQLIQLICTLRWKWGVEFSKRKLIDDKLNENPYIQFVNPIVGWSHYKLIKTAQLKKIFIDKLNEHIDHNTESFAKEFQKEFDDYMQVTKRLQEHNKSHSALEKLKALNDLYNKTLLALRDRVTSLDNILKKTESSLKYFKELRPYLSEMRSIITPFEHYKKKIEELKKSGVVLAFPEDLKTTISELKENVVGLKKTTSELLECNDDCSEVIGTFKKRLRTAKELWERIFQSRNTIVGELLEYCKREETDVKDQKSLTYKKDNATASSLYDISSQIQEKISGIKGCNFVTDEKYSEHESDRQTAINNILTCLQQKPEISALVTEKNRLAKVFEEEQTFPQKILKSYIQTHTLYQSDNFTCEKEKLDDAFKEKLFEKVIKLRFGKVERREDNDDKNDENTLENCLHARMTLWQNVNIWQNHLSKTFIDGVDQKNLAEDEMTRFQQFQIIKNRLVKLSDSLTRIPEGAAPGRIISSMNRSNADIRRQLAKAVTDTAIVAVHHHQPNWDIFWAHLEYIFTLQWMWFGKKTVTGIYHGYSGHWTKYKGMIEQSSVGQSNRSHLVRQPFFNVYTELQTSIVTPESRTKNEQDYKALRSDKTRDTDGSVASQSRDRKYSFS